MARRLPDDRLRPTDEPKPEDLQQQLLKQVLSATHDGMRLGNQNIDLYKQVIEKWRGTPWKQDTIGEALVGASLTKWFTAVPMTDPAKVQLIHEITGALFEDPIASVKFEKWWQELQESHG